MILQNGFVAKFPKKCDVGQHVWFCCIWFTWWRCVICPQHVTADLTYFIFYFCDNFKFSNSNKKNNEYNPWLPLLPHETVRMSHKKSATNATMVTDAASHHGCNFSCNSLFWLLRLHRLVLPPNNNAGLFDCCQAGEAAI